MATTKIWKVDTHLNRVLEYAKDTTKTENPTWSKSEYQAMRDVMDYAMDDAKTEQQFYVSGINCEPSRARDQMMLTKQRFNKTSGILAWHGYQSFAEGEVEAATAHEIGIRLAQELWPDFEVIVATHLNTHCYHNHFVLNSVSYLHGKKFNACRASYRRMREVSDRLCKEYALSVIAEQQGIAKHYAEWMAEQNGQPTWRSLIRDDIDAAIKSSMTFQQFTHNLREKGYAVERRGKYLRVRPPGKERFVRLVSLGEAYTEDAIMERIMRQERRTHTPKPEQRQVQRVRVRGDFHLSKVTWKGLRALYYFYLRKLREASRQPKVYVPRALREELHHLDAVSEQAKFIARYKLDTAEQVESQKASFCEQAQDMAKQRARLRNLCRRVGITDDERNDYAEQIRTLSGTLKEIRKSIRLCDNVLERSLLIRATNEQLREEQRKELIKDESARRSCGADRQYGNQRDR